MSVSTLTADRQAFRRRTRSCLIASGTLHVVLLLWLALRAQVVAGDDVLTEVTWIEPTPVVVAPPVAVAPVVDDTPPAPRVVTPVQVEEPSRFERSRELAETAPEPQTATRTADALEARAASLRAERQLSKPGLSTMLPDHAVSRPTLAGAAAGPVSRAGRVDLTRKESATSAPLAMTRGTATPGSRPLTMAMVASPTADRAPAIPASIDSTRVRDLAGARLLGPVADRPLLSHHLPEYPDWAKREGVEGSVSLRFLVQPDGRVRENVLVERTSGFEDFDANATSALLAWMFEPLAGSSMGDQWGVITFNYRLSGR